MEVKVQPLIIDGKMYIVCTTSKFKIRLGDWYLFRMGDDWELMHCHEEDEADRCNNHFWISDCCAKIIATDNFEVESLRISLDDTREIVRNYDHKNPYNYASKFPMFIELDQENPVKNDDGTIILKKQ